MMSCADEVRETANVVTPATVSRLDHDEIANSITHGFGLALSLAGAVALLKFAELRGGGWLLAGCGIYAATLVSVYAASTLSHAIQTPALKRRFQIWDQGLIYLLIAGSFTPVALMYLSTGWWWTLLAAMWVIAVLGFVSKVMLEHRIDAVSVVACIAMGWLPTLAIGPIVATVPTPGLIWIVVGGLCYTVGTLFLVWDHKFRYAHAVWHLFVIGGSSCHYAVILVYVVLLQGA